MSPSRTGRRCASAGCAWARCTCPGDLHHLAIGTRNRAFTGDALPVGGCRRIDFHNGDPRAFYRSGRERPDATRCIARTTTGASAYRASRRKSGATRGSAAIAASIRSSHRGRIGLRCRNSIDYAVPGNRACGVCPDDLPDTLREYRPQMADSPQE